MYIVLDTYSYLVKNNKSSSKDTERQIVKILKLIPITYLSSVVTGHVDIQIETNCARRLTGQFPQTRYSQLQRRPGSIERTALSRDI